MRKYLYLIILCLWGNKVFASPSLKSITIDKSLEYGEYLSLNPWYDFMDLADEYRFEEENALQPYGESINWYVDGKYCDEEVFSVSRHTSSGDSHPWGELTNYPYQLATYLIKANEGQVGLHVFSITLRYLYLYKKEDGTKITEITSSTIKYNIQLPEPYVVLSNDNTTLTFYFDTKKKERNGMDIGPQVYNEPWINYRNNITTVIFDDSFANYDGLTSTAYWFYSCSNLSTISGIQNLNTSKVNDMSSMFQGCRKLETLDLSSFNTENVTDMSFMFMGCNKLTTLDVSNFNTQNVTNMLNMFYECYALRALDVSKFDTQNVTKMDQMFSSCISLTALDVSKFDTKNVTNMGFMFEDCNSLVTLDVSKFDTRNVTNMKFMFDGCKSLNTLCLTNINTKNVTTMEHMFYECESLTTLDISMFNTQNVTNMFRMFWGCKALKILDLSNFNTNKVTKMSYMFYWCDSLTTIYAGPNWSTRNVTDGEDMFGCCEKLIGGQGTKYDYKHTDFTYAHIDGGVVNPGYFTEKTTIINITFADPVVKAICVERWDTDGDGELSEAEAAAVENLNNAFYNNQEITSFDELQYFTGLTAINGDFYSCSKLTSIIIPENVTRIGLKNGWAGAFAWCYDLASVTLGDKVEMIDESSFQGCSSLISINFPSGLKSIGYDAFYGCSTLPSLIIPSSVEYIHDGAFDFCSGLTSIVVEKGNQYYDSRENCNALIATQYNTLIVGSSNSFIPNTVTSISRLAFRFRNGLNSLTIPKSVTRIGNEAFAGCVGLNYIIVEEGNPTYDSRDNCNAIIETETNSLLLGCKNTIFPDNVMVIGPFAFRGCSDITSIIIPNSVRSIEESAFYECSGLSSVVIGKSVDVIGSAAFYGTNLQDVYCYAENVPNATGMYGNDAFLYNDLENVTLHVPAASMAAYRADNIWKKFGSIAALTDNDPKPTGISSVNQNTEIIRQYYSLDGKRLTTPQRGLNIIRMEDGTTRKVMVK